MSTIAEITRDHKHRESAEKMAYHSFLRTYRAALSKSLVPDPEFFRVLHYEFEKHLASKKGRLLVAPHKGFEDEWAGWALGGPDILVWVYVKEAFRGQGISASLVNSVWARGRLLVWYPYHGAGAESYLVAIERSLGVRFRYSPRCKAV